MSSRLVSHSSFPPESLPRTLGSVAPGYSDQRWKFRNGSDLREAAGTPGTSPWPSEAPGGPGAGSLPPNTHRSSASLLPPRPCRQPDTHLPDSQTRGLPCPWSPFTRHLGTRCCSPAPLHSPLQPPPLCQLLPQPGPSLRLPCTCFTH